MDIAELQAFIEVARYASFSKAAEHMHLTQPAVSKRVASLELVLGANLFNRIARQIDLTETGRQLLPKAQELVNQAKDMKRFASSLNDQVSGSLSVAISHHIALYRLPPILAEFNQLYPAVKLDIRFEDSEQAFSSVERGDIEFALITLPHELPASLQAQPLWRDDLQVVVGKTHALSQQATITLGQLAEHSAVLPAADTETHQIIQREFEQAELTMNVQMQTNNLQSLKMLVVAGTGWSLLPQTMLDEELQVLDIGCKLTRDLGLVVHRKRSFSNAARAMSKLFDKHAYG
jgi:DNA-binding transcriptional LysR family regulator